MFSRTNKIIQNTPVNLDQPTNFGMKTSFSQEMDHHPPLLRVSETCSRSVEMPEYGHRREMMVISLVP